MTDEMVGFALASGFLIFFGSMFLWVGKDQDTAEGRKKCRIVACCSFVIAIIAICTFCFFWHDSVSQRKAYKQKEAAREQEIVQARIAKENSPSGQIQKVTEMQVSLKKQIETIKTTQSKYQSTINNLSSEIRKEKETKHIISLDQASERMKYNIQLIQEVDAYQTELIKHLQMTENGLEEAVYVERRLNAKKLMADVIGDSKILGQEVDTLLKKYGPLMNQYVIDPKKLTMKSPEEIWNQIKG
jgi:cell division protein FtsI/penicillin-binding protein 2